MEVRLTQEDFDTLRMCRNAARAVAQIERRVNSFLPTSAGMYKSPSFSGMPGARDPHGLDGSSSKNDAEFEELEREKANLERYREPAQRVILKLDENMHDFCLAYFVRGEDLSVVQISTGLSESTCKRRLKDLRYFADNFRKQRSQMNQNEPAWNKMNSVAT